MSTVTFRATIERSGDTATGMDAKSDETRRRRIATAVETSRAERG